MTWTLADTRHVQSRIAAALLSTTTPEELGDITLLPHQRDAVDRIRAAIHTHHGALLADDVGLGKTYTALAVASVYERVHVIAPATLQPMWRTAITHAQLTQVKLHSVHGFARATAPDKSETAAAYSVREAPAREWRRLSTLVVIDEAHYLRTRRTARYAAVARFVAGCDTLLITATPLHNRAEELRNLLGLFLGSRADLLSDSMLAQVVIRRTASHTRQHAVHAEQNADAGRAFRAQTAHPPKVVRHAPQHMPHDRATLTHILELPAPLPAHDGAVAGALIRLGLLRAWCSSDAALAQALRQRRLRGHALLQSLRAGRHPTQQELRGWLVGDHEVQLAFPELMAQQEVDAGPFIELLAAHLDGLERLAEHHERTAQGDASRVEALKALMHRHPGTPIIAFSQFTHTISALHRALSDIAGVGALSSRQAHIAGGRISRSDALARFAPLAQERPPPKAHDAIRLLLSTDLLAEGVNLQDAGVVVHLDLPWTAALREQRVGRCARIGSHHQVVHVYSFAPPPAGDRALRLQRRLAEKAQLGRRYTGALRRRGGRKVRSAASAATELRELLQQWRHFSFPYSNEAADNSTTEFAAINASRSAWLAHIERNGDSLLLCGYSAASGLARRRVSTRSRALLRVALFAHSAEAQGGELALRSGDNARLSGAVRQAEQDIQRWHERGVIREEAGPSASTVSLSGRRVARLIEQIAQSCSSLQRHKLRHQISAARGVVASARGTGAEQALHRWAERLAHAGGASGAECLGEWANEPLLAAVSLADAAGERAVDGRGLLRVRAMLLLVGPGPVSG